MLKGGNVIEVKEKLAAAACLLSLFIFTTFRFGTRT